MKRDWTADIRRQLANHEMQAPDGLLNDVKRSLSQESLSQESLSQGNHSQGNLSQGNLSQGNLSQESLSQESLSQESLSQESLSPSPSPAGRGGALPSIPQSRQRAQSGQRARLVRLWPAAATVVAAALIGVVFLVGGEGNDSLNPGSLSPNPSPAGRGTSSLSPNPSPAGRGTSLTALTHSSTSLATVGSWLSQARQAVADRASAVSGALESAVTSTTSSVASTDAASSAASDDALLADGASTIPSTGRGKRLQGISSHSTPPPSGGGGKGGKAKSRFSFGTTTSAFPASSSSQGMLLAAAAPMGDNVPEGFGDKETGTMALAGDPSRHTHYKRPVKVGLSVGYRLSDRWNLYSGMTYSYLSQTTTYDNMPAVREKQRLHYVGVPLGVSYTIAQRGRLRAYASAGMEVQKLVSGRRTTTGIAATSTTDNLSATRSAPSTVTVREHIHESRPQFSVGAAVGAELRLLPHVSAYVEPSVTHYIDNGSSVDNYFKDKKTRVGIGAGFRLGF